MNNHWFSWINREFFEKLDHMPLKTRVSLNVFWLL